jgi:dTDP-4-dehydrorhamnose 3,5-epimerase
MIDGVKVTPLETGVDQLGRRLNLLRAGDPDFRAVGEVVVLTVYPGVVRAWHGHETRAENLACIDGMVKAVLVDARPSSPTRGQVDEVFLGVWNPVRLHIPPGVYHGLKGISTNEAVLINISSSVSGPNDPDELHLAPDAAEIPYDWRK